MHTVDLLLPGIIDPQVHFREPGATHKEDLGSGSRAAVRGGVTSFLEMPNCKPATVDQAQLDWKLNRAAETCVANYGFFYRCYSRQSAIPEHHAPCLWDQDFYGIKHG